MQKLLLQFYLHISLPLAGPMRQTEKDHSSRLGTNWADPEGGTGGPDPPEKSKKYRVSKQYWSGSSENHKAAKPAFHGGPSSACQRNAITMAFR